MKTTSINKKDILDYIIEYKKTHNGCSPATEDIGRALFYSNYGYISKLLWQMEKEGKIKLGHAENGRVIAKSIEIPGYTWGEA